MKKIILCAALLASVFAVAHAELEPMKNVDLQAVDGQASAATIDWLLSLNQVRTPNPSFPSDRSRDLFEFDSETCSDLRFCRFAMASNNRYDNGSYIDATGTIRKPDGSAGTAADLGKKQWVVFKGMQGTIHIQNMQIDGADLLYRDDSNAEQIKAALQLTFDAAHPIRIRNFGFNAVSIETDTVANEGAGNVPGYLAMGSGGTGEKAYANGVYTNTTNKFDQGRETGFTGLSMNGNLALQGTLKVFSCDASMKRC